MEARLDLVRVHGFLAPVNRQAAARVVQRPRSVPELLLLDHPRLGYRLAQFAPREVRRLIVDDSEPRYELMGDTIFIANIWHTREDR